MTYRTIDAVSQAASQRAFLRNLARGEAYQAEAPTLWDVTFRTAVAQAELEEREVAGAYHRLRFAPGGEGAGEGVEIETTRPELLPACVAVVVHPDDGRYHHLVGAQVLTPLFRARVPVRSHPLADPEKGTGAAMVCTFGDSTDVSWWRELGLPSRVVVGRDGRLVPVQWGAPGWETSDAAAAQAAYDQLSGLPTHRARERVVELAGASGDLLGEPRAITHPVKYYEKGERPLEFVTSRQWFVPTLAHREALLARGKELHWHPGFMEERYSTWVEALTGDWNISRQRYFGVPFPVWYPIDPQGQVDHDHPLMPAEARLPVDPSTDAPEGYEEAQRGKPEGFVGDQDVMDTWATSSLTPQIAGGWEDDPDLFGRVFPMDLRPQGHDIIRTWLFSTVVRSQLEHGSLPWSDALISGFIVDPERKKMSKSRGNVVTPMELLERYGSDAVRYWAASGRPGMDATFDPARPEQIKVGRRLAIKILNASRFVLSLAAREPLEEDDAGQAALPPPDAVDRLDRDLLARLSAVVAEATAAFDGYDYARALERVESFFWFFCDDYLELVKTRAYGEEPTRDGGGGRPPDPAPGTTSARACLARALSVLLRLFAPILPFVTEEVWSWWQEGSIHRAPWPRAADLDVGGVGGDRHGGTLDLASEVLGAIRRTKSEAHRSMRAPVARLVVVGGADALDGLRPAHGDLRAAGTVTGSIDEAPVATEGIAEVRVDLAESQRG
jgi:valyl-tRNA synthetase